MLETDIKKLTEAVINLTKVLEAQALPQAKDPILESEPPASSAVIDIFGDDKKEVSAPAPTIDDVKVTLKAYLEKEGEKKTLDLLTQFKASKVTELKEEDYEKIIAAATS